MNTLFTSEGELLENTDLQSTHKIMCWTQNLIPSSQTIIHTSDILRTHCLIYSEFVVKV